jgi:glycine betaine/proline transport system ATP-binding protein
LMTPAHALRTTNGEVLLDASGRLRIRLDEEGKPVAVTLDGAAGKLAVADGETGASEAARADVIVAPADLKMRAAIELRRATGNPIVLVDQLGRMAGLCGDDEIYRALLQRAPPAA